MQTIASSKNLLYIEAKDLVVAGTKGTSEYDRIMIKLQEEAYAHQKEEKKADDDDDDDPQE